MPRFAASLMTMFNEWPLPDRFAAARDAGFQAVELQAPYAMDPEAISAKLEANGLELVLINCPSGDQPGDRGLAALPGRRDDFLASLEKALRYVRRTGAKRVHLLSGTGPDCDQDTWEASLREAADRFARVGATVLIEPLNTRDNPGYFLASFDRAAAAIEKLALPNLKLQYDIYHRQMLHGDITASLKSLMPIIGHIQIAGVPGRHEPADCEIDYEFVLSEIDRLGFSGWVGCEYRPRNGTLDGLGWVKRWLRPR